MVAIATGNAWAIPLIDGASAAANGGDLGDVLKTVAVSYVAGEIGAEVAQHTAPFVDEFIGEALERRRKRVSRIRDNARYCWSYASHYSTGKTRLKPLLEEVLPLRYPQV